MPDNVEIIERPKAGLVPAGEAIILLAPMLEAIPRIDEDGGEAILTRILMAETLDDVFAPLDTEGLLELLDTPIQVQSIRWGDSSFDSGLGVFFVVEAQRANGDRIVTTTGSSTCMVQLARAYCLGAIPGLIVIPRQAKKETKNGYRPLNLERVS